MSVIRSLVLVLLVAVTAAPTEAERIKDIAGFAGVRTNQLVGYGLVVGLDGSGDQVIQAPFTVQSLKSMLAQLGVNHVDHTPSEPWTEWTTDMMVQRHEASLTFFVM